MGIPNAGGRKIRPTHPGAMLREDFLPDYGLAVSRLAEALGVSRQTVNDLPRERRALSPEMALRLSRLFGSYPTSGSMHSARSTCAMRLGPSGPRSAASSR
jgi:addiction module HigA family antidote